METTRRQLMQAVLAGTALVAAGGKAFAGSQAGSGPIAGKNTSTSAKGEWVSVPVSDKTQMKLYVARPEGQKAKAPAVIVLQEIFGVNSYIRDVTERIASLGYVAVAPDLFHRIAPGYEGDYKDMTLPMEYYKKMTDEALSADLQAAYDWAKQDSLVDNTHIGSVGFCMGGRSSFLANAVLPLQAAAVFYGGGIADTLITRAKDQHAPLILFSGGKDDHIGREKQNAVAAALKVAGKQYVDIEFSEAQHGFFCDQRGSYNPEASREAWAILVAFLKEHLGA